MYKTFLVFVLFKSLPRALQITEIIECRTRFHQKSKGESSPPLLYWSIVQNCQGAIHSFCREGSHMLPFCAQCSEGTSDVTLYPVNSDTRMLLGC